MNNEELPDGGNDESPAGMERLREDLDSRLEARMVELRKRDEQLELRLAELSARLEAACADLRASQALQMQDAAQSRKSFVETLANLQSAVEASVSSITSDMVDIRSMAERNSDEVRAKDGLIASQAATLEEVRHSQQVFEGRLAELDAQVAQWLVPDRRESTDSAFSSPLEQQVAELRIDVESRASRSEAALAQGMNDVRSYADSLLSAYAVSREWMADGLVNANEGLAWLRDRVEFIRRELMFEIRYGDRDPMSSAKGSIASGSVQASVINHVLVNAAREQGDVRLNLGCGHLPLPGYINVDLRHLPGVDVVAEVNDLPFSEGEVSAIHSAHMLEHFPEEQLKRKLIPYWRSLLKPGGRFSAVVPDAEAMIHAYVAGDYSYEHLREVTFGGQDYAGDFHFNMFTPDSLHALLVEMGFSDIRIVEKGRKNGQCFEFEIEATAGGGA
ncbi:hypothetical protein DCD74_08465 [Lysobacter oculi]|uniref:Methyltransferase type 11 domain-containing protein n=1 Tax=Solilutibacter oculi TaxID=2698682 RepID=A0A344J6Q7_9GAMM|nr:hypothetical protein [Lysobacter oculi]AXA84717.1 hypothetical protein DCD74_08465 [Lysobacter oculi]